MPYERKVTLEEMEARFAKWADEHPELLAQTAAAARRAAANVLRDARVTPEQLRQPVDF